jgi:hypothetical protein
MKFSVVFLFALVSLALAMPTDIDEARFINTISDLFNQGKINLNKYSNYFTKFN